MASIRLTQFAGLMPELSAKLKRKDNAQIAHNCLLYNGTLQAMPAYILYENLVQAPTSMVRASQSAHGRVVPIEGLIEAVFNENPPFLQAAVGIIGGSPETGGNYIAMIPGQAGTSLGLRPAGVDPPFFTVAPKLVITTAGHATPRPECVSYAVTAVRQLGSSIEESIPLLLGTVGNGVLSDPASISTLWHQGDRVLITFSYDAFFSGQTGFRLYRTVTAIETGEQLVNTFDTEWNLVAYVPAVATGGNFLFADTVLTQYLPGSTLLSKTFYPPFFGSQPQRFGMTESGWLWFTTDYEIQFAERYMVHAWPMQNYMQINKADTITDAKSFYDTLFMGTSGRPYRCHIGTSDDDAIEASAVPFQEHQPCIANSMVVAPFGVLYTSPNGFVSLEDTKMQVISRDLINGQSILYTQCVDGVEQTFSFADVKKAVWFNGMYIGYDGEGKIFIYEPPEDLNDDHPFQQLVTMDAPVDIVPGPWSVGDFGLQIAFDKGLYYWPIPGWQRPMDTPQKLCYRWKSKKFVFPGRTAFAAAKVVWLCDGEVCFTLIGDCGVVYSRKVTDCNPFRLPLNNRVEWEIELTGTGTISEVHVATSEQELTEVGNE